MAVEMVTGDDFLEPVTLKKNGLTFTINPSASVKAALVKRDRSGILIAASVCSANAPGADWAQSRIILPFTALQTSDVMEFGRAIIEIQVDDGGKKTWFTTLEVIKGFIS